MKIIDSLLSWFNSPAGMFLEAGSPLYYPVRGMGLLLFALAWVYAARLRAQASGWVELGARYPLHRLIEPEFSGLQTVYIGGVKYWRAVGLAAVREGLVLRAAWLTRPFHQAFLVPWSEMEDLGTTDYNGIIYRSLSLDRAFKTRLLVAESLYSKLAGEYAAAVPRPVSQSLKA